MLWGKFSLRFQIRNRSLHQFTKCKTGIRELITCADRRALVHVSLEAVPKRLRTSSWISILPKELENIINTIQVCSLESPEFPLRDQEFLEYLVKTNDILTYEYGHITLKIYKINSRPMEPFMGKRHQTNTWEVVMKDNRQQTVSSSESDFVCY